MCAVSKERDEKGFRVDGGRETKRETSPMKEERRWTGKQAEESKNQLASLNPGLGGRSLSLFRINIYRLAKYL